MFVVNRSYRELTGFQPVELTDNSVLVDVNVNLNYRQLTPANFRRRSRLTSINSQQAKLETLTLLRAVCQYYFFAILSARTFIQKPPMTERALKPTMLPVFVSYQSLMGTREEVSFT